MSDTEKKATADLARIRKDIETHPVVIYMKGTAQFPQCGFSARACAVLKAAGVESLHSVNVLEDDALWDALEGYTKWPTVPQIFIGGQFIGGCDIVSEMYESGELQKTLREVG